MPHTMTRRPQRARPIVHNATRPLVMPDANALTRELTAAILERHSLLDEHPPSAVPCTAAVRQRAAALRHEVARLCARAVALQREAKQLCQPWRSAR
jgi:hypothetical protein